MEESDSAHLVFNYFFFFVTHFLQTNTTGQVFIKMYYILFKCLMFIYYLFNISNYNFFFLECSSKFLSVRGSYVCTYHVTCQTYYSYATKQKKTHSGKFDKIPLIQMYLGTSVIRL